MDGLLIAATAGCIIDADTGERLPPDQTLDELLASPPLPPEQRPAGVTGGVTDAIDRSERESEK